MALTGDHTYVGFGFGAIQAGLFLYEAFRSGNFRRLVVAEVLPEVVENLRAAGGMYAVNIAHADRVEPAYVGPVEVFNPASDADRDRLVDAVAEAHEIGTAVPSVANYATGRPGSLHNILARGLGKGRGRSVVYAAENDNRAAETLRDLVVDELDDAGAGRVEENVQFVNTVIGKMSGLADAAELEPMTPNSSRAFLVEAFNRIFVSRVRLGRDFRRGIEVFEEKDDLLPFEEAKLFGHNATHALAAYLAAAAGMEKMADLRRLPGFVPFLRDAFVEESGRALIARHGGSDELFTPDGYRRYADDLLERMTNPFLMDTVERVGRDPRRKLGWDDRLVGTMRLALSEGIEPRRYALGAAAALNAIDPHFLPGQVSAAELAEPIWDASNPDPTERDDVTSRIERARGQMLAWRDSGFGNLQERFARE
jgi:mannitol-1-phosphate 5-dehydrogenase